MGVLWRWISLRHLLHEGGRTALTLLGVALGVAVLVAIRLANHSALAAFSETVDAVAGRANLQVTGDGTGFDERVFPRVRELPGVLAAAPVVQAYALARAGGAAAPGRPELGKDRRYPETLLVMGLDVLQEQPFARFEERSVIDRERGALLLLDSRAAAVTAAFARRRGLREGDALTLLSGGRPVTLNIRLILHTPELQQAMGGSVVLVDIATAQEVFGRYGRLDRIDLIVDLRPGGTRRAEVTQRVAALLPPSARVGSPLGRTRQVENMVRAFELNLTALSFIALFVAMFLIFNSVSMAVLRRRAEIGTLRGLGVRRAQITRQFLLEAAALGLAGGVLGLALGTLLARAALGAVEQTLTALYLVVHARQLHLAPLTYLLGLGVGIATSLASALVPALEAAGTPPGRTMREGVQIDARGLPVGRWTAAGGALVLAAAAAAYATVRARQPLAGFASATLLVTGFALLAPLGVLAMERAAAPVLRRLLGIPGLLGARYLREALPRTSVVAAALMVSVSMLVGLAIMVGSFRRTVDVWVGQTLRGDLYVEPVGRSVGGSATVLPEWLTEKARALPGVAAVDTYRGTQITHNGRIAFAAGVDFEVQRRFGRLQLLESAAGHAQGAPGRREAGGDSCAVLGAARDRGGVVVTESFGFHHRVRAGDLLELDTPSGRVRLPVLGVFYDYSTDAGAVLMDHRLYARLWRDRRTESLAVYLRPGVDVEAVRAGLLAAAGESLLLYATPNQKLRARVLAIFDQTFQITYALQAIAVAVAVLGVVGTLTALILQRGREIGILRAVGASRSQVRTMVLAESGLIGLTGSLLGCACGMALSLLLIYVINKQFFGWSIRLTVDPAVFAQAVGLMLVTAVLAGLGPARLAAGAAAGEAMRAE